MTIIDVDGQSIYYERIGSGDPLLLMHGWIQVGRDLESLAAQLASRYQVIVVDMPGYGQSVPPLRSYPADFYQRDAAIMVKFLDKLGLTNVHIMGFSDGGEVALLLPILRPDLCRSVTAWGAIGAFDPDACERCRQNLPPTWITDKLRADHPGQDVDQWPYQWVEAFCALIAAGGDISLSRAALIRCPLLLLLGENDSLNPPPAGQRYLHAAGSTAKILKIFAGASHAIHEQQPELFLQTVFTFLNEARTD
jgi:valacyclovir hydrolase